MSRRPPKNPKYSDLYLAIVFYLDEHPADTGKAIWAILNALNKELKLTRCGDISYSYSWADQEARGVLTCSELAFSFKRTDAASPQVQSALLGIGARGGSALFDSVKRGADELLVDCNWRFDFIDARGHDLMSQKMIHTAYRMHDSMFCIVLDKEYLQENGELAARRTVDAIARVAANEVPCYYGFAEFVYPLAVHGSTIFREVTWSDDGGFTKQWGLEEGIWWELSREERRTHVRRVYTCNFLGPRLAELFDPGGKDIDEILSVPRLQRTVLLRSLYAKRYENGSLLISVDDDLNSTMNRNGRLIDLTPEGDTGSLVWLNRRFRERGMLM